MTEAGFALFDTAIGACGIAWRERGIVGVQLPEASADKTRARMQRRFPQVQEATPPARVQRAIDGIVALLRGEPADLTDVPVDLADQPDFHNRVFAIARNIPPGATRTYGEIASELGDRALAREVGAALGKNPVPLIVPCHRVLAAGGATGGFSANGGVATKLQLLTIEGARTRAEPELFERLPLIARPRRRL